MLFMYTFKFLKEGIVDSTKFRNLGNILKLIKQNFKFRTKN